MLASLIFLQIQYSLIPGKLSKCHKNTTLVRKVFDMIYVYTYIHGTHTHAYIYIYMRVCVCVWCSYYVCVRLLFLLCASLTSSVWLAGFQRWRRKWDSRLIYYDGWLLDDVEGSTMANFNKPCFRMMISWFPNLCSFLVLTMI